MTWPENLDAAFPSRRSDEPPELRERIVREVRDHLECAFKRELIKTGDAAEAARRVQAQFGDPRHVARKLWFDAMREKIMSQRIVVGIAAAVAVACIAIVGVTLRLAQQMADQGRESQQALLATLERLVDRTNGRASTDYHAPADYVGVRIKLVKDIPGGEPAGGYDVGFSHVGIDAEAKGTLVEAQGVSDSAGMFDAGMVLPAAYQVVVATPWREKTERIVYIRPGNPVDTIEIVCPGADLPFSTVAIEADWPPELDDRDVGLVFFRGSLEREITAGKPDWKPRDWHRYDIDPEREYLILTREGGLLHLPLDWAPWRGDTPWVPVSTLKSEPVAGASWRGSTHVIKVEGAVLLPQELARMGLSSERLPKEADWPSQALLIQCSTTREDLTATPVEGQPAARVTIPFPDGLLKKLRQEVDISGKNGTRYVVPALSGGPKTVPGGTSSVADSAEREAEPTR